MTEAELAKALRACQMQSRQGIRKAAFSIDIGAPMSEKFRLGVADECRRLEDFVELVLRKHESPK